MHTGSRWTEIMVSSLDRHFPWACDCDTPIPPDRLRLRLHEFAREVDEQVAVNSDGRDILEWRVASAMLRVLVKKIKRIPRRGSVNCLNAFGPHSDGFVWAVYRNNVTVRDAIDTWRHHLGWKHVYIVDYRATDLPTDISRYGVHLVGLRSNSLLNRLSAMRSQGQWQHRQTNSLPADIELKQGFTAAN